MTTAHGTNSVFLRRFMHLIGPLYWFRGTGKLARWGATGDGWRMVPVLWRFCWLKAEAWLECDLDGEGWQ